MALAVRADMAGIVTAVRDGSWILRGMLASLRRILMALLIIWLASQLLGAWFMRGAHREIEAAEQRRIAEGQRIEEEMRRPPAENDTFREGRDHILRLQSVHWRDCPFSQGDGYRGCGVGFERVRGEREAAGRAWAQAHRPQHAYDCQGDVWFQRGCREVYRQELAPGGLVFPDLPLTTSGADCFKELAAYEALNDAYHDAIGMPHAAAVQRGRLGPMYRQDCKQRQWRDDAALKAAGTP